MVGKVVWCKCGSLIRSISELKNVHQLGLSLRGSCPGCGELVGVNSLWRRKKLIVKVVKL